MFLQKKAILSESQSSQKTVFTLYKELGRDREKLSYRESGNLGELALPLFPLEIVKGDFSLQSNRSTTTLPCEELSNFKIPLTYQQESTP